MEKSKRINTQKYVWILSVFFLAVLYFCIISFLWALYFIPENYKNLCEVVTIGRLPYDFKIDDKNGCQIQWMYLLKEPFLFSFIMILPFLAIGKFLKIILKIKRDF